MNRPGSDRPFIVPNLPCACGHFLSEHDMGRPLALGPDAPCDGSRNEGGCLCLDYEPVLAPSRAQMGAGEDAETSSGGPKTDG